MVAKSDAALNSSVEVSVPQPAPLRINTLQGLRAYAALPVVLFHTQFVLPGVNKIGIFGVHMFFLLSGYLMAQICTTDRHAFMRRRLIRIVPSYWFMTLLLYIFAARFPYLMNATHAVPSELIKSLFFIPFQKSNGLFQPILFVGWSVNYEMYFYTLLGLSLLIAPRMPLLVASLSILSIGGICRLFAASSPIARFYADPMILEFIFGLLAYYCVAAIPEERRAKGKFVWAGIVLASLILLPVIEAFNLLPSLPLVVRFGPLSFLLISASCLLALGGNDLRAGLIVLIGDASYTLYLVHPYVEMLIDRIFARRVPWLHIATPLGCVVAVTAAVSVSIALYLYVEKPMLRYLTKKFCGRIRGSHESTVATPRLTSQIETTGPMASKPEIVSATQ
jgi:exopolysaccharide production protein ExoZ